MSVKSRFIMSAVALTLVAGVGSAGTLTANAATAACTAAASQTNTQCVNWYSLAFGSAYVMGVEHGVGQAGQPVILGAASGGNTGEDFQQTYQGTVTDFVSAGLMAPGLDTYYANLPVYEIQYTPGGTPSGLCVGVPTTPDGLGTLVVLVHCGVSALTTWILDPVPSTAPLEGSALISGATDSNFDHPYSLTALARGFQLATYKLRLHEPEALRNRQLWTPFFGTL